MMGLIFKDEGYAIKSLPLPIDLDSILVEFAPDVILMDIFMGEYNGVEICRELKSNPNHKALKIVLTTASNTFNNLDRLSTLADGHIAKPFDINEVVKLIDEVLGN